MKTCSKHAKRCLKHVKRFSKTMIQKSKEFIPRFTSGASTKDWNAPLKNVTNLIEVAGSPTRALCVLNGLNDQ